MARALADHSTETLNRYAKKVFDASTRLFRGLPTATTLEVLTRAAKCLWLARYIDTRHGRAPVATEINETLATLNKLRAELGDTPVTL